MTAIFNTPLAAALLAIEVLLFEWKPRSFVPVVVAVLVAWAWRPLMIGTGPMFGFDTVVPGGAWPVVAASAIGLVVGIEAALLSAALYRIEDIFHRLPFHWMWWPAIGGVAVGLGGLVDAHVLGPGYASIQALLDGRSEEHTSELQSLMRTSYAVFCLQKQKEYKILLLMNMHHTLYNQH